MRSCAFSASLSSVFWSDPRRRCPAPGRAEEVNRPRLSMARARLRAASGRRQFGRPLAHRLVEAGWEDQSEPQSSQCLICVAPGWIVPIEQLVLPDRKKRSHDADDLRTRIPKARTPTNRPSAPGFEAEPVGLRHRRRSTPISDAGLPSRPRRARRARVRPTRAPRTRTRARRTFSTCEPAVARRPRGRGT